MQTLPDYLRPGLDVIFVGLNPSLPSARIGHYYAGRGNQFWPFLHEAGFTDRLLTPQEDGLIITYNMGLTDLVKRPTSGIADLNRNEFRSGFHPLRKKLETFRPGVVCFNGKTGYRSILSESCSYGLQDNALEGATVFVAPSTSGALPIRRDEKLDHYKRLRALVTSISSKRC